MNCKFSLSQPLMAVFIFFIITANAWAVADPSQCTTQAQILNQSETESAEKKPEDNSDDDEEDEEEPECD